MKKLSIKIFQSFTNRYFGSRPPKVLWKKSKEWNGLADYKKRVIYINPDEEAGVQRGCSIGDGLHFPKKSVALKDGEQYFLTLLHEIAHFKFRKNKAPNKKFHKIALVLKKEYPNDLERQIYASQDFLESGQQYDSFRMWFLGSVNHWQVETWARKEFQKRRKNIKKLLDVK